MRVLMVLPEDDRADRLKDALRSRGWTIDVVPTHGGAPRVAVRTSTRALRARPRAALVHGSALAAGGVLAALRVPFVVLADPTEAPINAAQAAILRGAAAVIVDHWAQGLALSAKVGSLKVVTAVPGIDLSVHPLGPQSDALNALGLSAEQRMGGVISGPEAQLDLLDPIYRQHPGVGWLIAGGEPILSRVRAMQLTTRPSSPIRPMGDRSPATDLITACAARVGLDLDRPGPGDGAYTFVAQGRRLVTIAGENATPLLDLYPPELRVVHIVRPTEEGVRAGLAAAWAAEDNLGPLPASAVDEARRQLDRDGWPRRIGDVVEACA